MKNKANKKQDYIVTTEILTGSDSKAFNAVVNALRASSFVNFSQHFSEDFKSFFSKCFIEQEGKKKDLSIAYEFLPITQFKDVWQEVYNIRAKEFNKMFEEKEFDFKELNEIDKIKYTLMYNFGDKLGGYSAIASLNLQEILKLSKFFSGFEADKSKHIDNKKNK